MGFACKTGDHGDMKRFWSVLLLSLPCQGAVFTLQQTASTVRERAPEIRSRLALAESRRAQADQAGSLSNPNIIVQSGRLKSGPYQGSVVDVTVMQPLPFPGKRRAAHDVMEAESRLALISGQEELLAIEHRAVLMAVRLAVLTELSHHTQERRHRFELVRKSLFARPQVSPIQQVERGLIENQLRILERGIALMESERRGLSRELGLWLGTEDELEINIPWGRAPKLESLSVWEQRILEHNLSLSRHKERKNQGEARLRQAELAAYPDFQVGLNYRQENVVPTNHFYHAQVGLTVPIFDHGQHMQQSAKAELRLEQARLEAQTRDLRAELAHAWEEADTQRKLLNTFNLALIKESEKQFHAAESEFRKGRIDATTFLSTDAQIHESVDAAFQTTLDALAASNRLRLMAGLPPET